MAKVATSKTNPGRKKGSARTKTYNGKPVVLAMYIARHCDDAASYKTAQYVGGGIVEDKDGKPIAWDAI